MSDCRIPAKSYGDTVAKLNENNRRLKVVAREMYQSLLATTSGWEDEIYNIKRYADELRRLGAL